MENKKEEKTELDQLKDKLFEAIEAQCKDYHKRMEEEEKGWTRRDMGYKASIYSLVNAVIEMFSEKHNSKLDGLKKMAEEETIFVSDEDLNEAYHGDYISLENLSRLISEMKGEKE